MPHNERTLHRWRRAREYVEEQEYDRLMRLINKEIRFQCDLKASEEISQEQGVDAYVAPEERKDSDQ